MSGCEHKISGSREKIWLTYYFEGRERGLKPHPYCIECGLIKNLSSEKPLSIGYFMNYFIICECVRIRGFVVPPDDNIAYELRIV